MYVVFADFLAEPYMNNREKQEELEKIIAGKLGKRVEVRMILQADESQLKGGRLSKIGLEDAIRIVCSTQISVLKSKEEGRAWQNAEDFRDGIPGNMNNLMKQAQKMQKQMEENQKALEEKEFTAAAGGGAVEVTVSGKKEVVKVKLAEEVVDPDDIEMLEDLIMAATNEALPKAGGRGRGRDV